jgi:hypothetical protein
MIITLQYIWTQCDAQGLWMIVTFYMNWMGNWRLVDDNYSTIYMNTIWCPRLGSDNYLIIYMNTVTCWILVDDNYLTIYMNTMGCPRIVEDSYLIYIWTQWNVQGWWLIIPYNMYEHNGMLKVGEWWLYYNICERNGISKFCGCYLPYNTQCEII